MLTLRSSEQEQHDDEQLEEPIQIHAFCDKADLTWTDGSGQAQSIDDVYFKVDIDTLISKAIFRLTCRIWVKGKDKNRTSVYLFIHPENIQTIRLEAIDGVSLLHFSMNQNYSRLVVPNDRVLECKHSTLPRLQSMKALAEIDTFTVHLKASGMTGLTHYHLRQIASTFSSPQTRRLETDDSRVDLQSLYSGIGGHVFNTGTIFAGGNNKRDQGLPEDTSPPPPIEYEPCREHKPHRKRKRERERERESSDPNYDRPSSDLKGLIGHLLDMENRLRNDMKVMTESSETRLRNDMKNAIESSRNRLRDDMKDMIESSEDRLRNHVKDVVEATGSRLKDDLNDMLDSRADEIDRRIDGSMDDLKTECIGTIESEFGYLKYGIEEVTKGIEEAEEKAKGVLVALDEAGDGIERRVGKYLNSIRLQVTVED
ncbi:hypothetical protein TRIATDRAFT_94626, partial [Trichoderma atroviride IMI 206040]